MARPATSEQARLRKLRSALDRAKKLDFGVVLTSQPMRELLGVSWPVLRGWCNDIPELDESGAFITGSEGNAWSFNPVATIWVLIRHFEKVREEKIAANAKMREAATGDALEGVPAEFDIRETREALNLFTQMRNLQVQDGKLIQRDAAVGAVREMLTSIQEATLGAPAVLDPTSDWPVELRERVDEALSRALVLQADAARNCLNKLGDDQPVAKEFARAG